MLILLGALYGLTAGADDLVQSASPIALGHTLVADWVAAFLVGVALTPVAAVGAVVLALELRELAGDSPAARAAAHGG